MSKIHYWTLNNYQFFGQHQYYKDGSINIAFNLLNMLNKFWIGNKYFEWLPMRLTSCNLGVKTINPGDGGLAEVSTMAGGGPRDPPPLNFAQNQFSCPKLGMLIPQGISNYVQFVSYNYLTFPAHGGLPNIPSRNCIC